MANDDLREKLRAIISEVSEVDEIPDETPFKDLGIGRAGVCHVYLYGARARTCRRCT